MERVSRNLVLRRRLPERFGSLFLYVSPGAALSYYGPLRGSRWTDLFDFAEHFVMPGDVVWDVGTNMGVFSFAAASRAGPEGMVLCLEADAWSVQMLRRSARTNGGRMSSIEILQVAISDRLGVETLNIPERGRAAAHLENAGGAGREITGDVREQQLVMTVSLDWLAEMRSSQPNVLKIDVDGGESKVLGGAKTMIEEKRPVILTEVYSRNSDFVAQYFREREYRIFEFDSGIQGVREIDAPAYNTLAVPSESEALPLGGR